MNHFADIGFKGASTQELLETSKFIKRGKIVAAKKHNYSLAKDKSGASLWFWYSKDGISCLNPHFEGKTRSKVFLTGVETTSNCENCVVLTGWMSPSEDDNPDSGFYPFGFSVPNYFSLKEFSFPQIADVQICAFAEEISVYEDEEDFNKQNKDLAANFFIPSGRFPVDENRRSEALFAGTIQSAKKLKNSFTGMEFYWLVVDTYGASIDLVCGLEMDKFDLRSKKIVSGRFWLSGIIMDKV